MACENNHFHIAKYLVNPTELTDYIDMRENNYLGFKWACARGYNELVHYLIFNMNMEKSKAIKAYFKHEPNEEIEYWFKVREEGRLLDKELPTHNNNKKITL